MRVLTVRQPWAWAIIHGGKNVENRTRNIAGTYRGPVAIHAGLTVDSGAPARVTDAWHGWFAMNGMSRRNPVDQLGVVIGVVDLDGVHWDGDLYGGCHAPDDTSICSQWAEPAQWHLQLTNARPLTAPVPARGRLGLWRPDEALTAAIRGGLS